MDWSRIINRKIIDVLIGDTKVFEEYGMPRLSGPDLCQLSTMFGLSRTYSYGGGGVNLCRWEYMQALLVYLCDQDKIPDLLAFLFKLDRFEELNKLGELEKIKGVYNCIVSGALKNINEQLMISQTEIRCVHQKFVLARIGETIVFDAPKVKITSQYIRELPERIKADIQNKDYDSVITKSRTLLEEVLIYIIEHLTKERYTSSGNLVKIYQEVTGLLNMRTRGDWDKRINELLGGLHGVVSSISSMRNMNSDAHGAGAGRLNIDEREAILVAHSAMILSEYWLSVYDKRSSR